MTRGSDPNPRWGRWLQLEGGVDVRRAVDEDGELVAEAWRIRPAPVVDLTGRNDNKLHPDRRPSR